MEQNVKNMHIDKATEKVSKSYSFFALEKSKDISQDLLKIGMLADELGVDTKNGDSFLCQMSHKYLDKHLNEWFGIPTSFGDKGSCKVMENSKYINNFNLSDVEIEIVQVLLQIPQIYKLYGFRKNGGLEIWALSSDDSIESDRIITKAVLDYNVDVITLSEGQIQENLLPKYDFVYSK